MNAKRLRVSMTLLQSVLGLPASATIIDASKGDFETVELLVIDGAFPMLPDGAEAPLVDLVATRVEAHWSEPGKGDMSDTEQEEHLLYEAWGVIANAGWDDLEKTEGWQEAAIRWRDKWHAYLDAQQVSS